MLVTARRRCVSTAAAVAIAVTAALTFGANPTPINLATQNFGFYRGPDTPIFERSRFITAVRAADILTPSFLRIGGGVVMQATAAYEDDACPLRVAYVPEKADGQRLTVSVNCETGTFHVSDEFIRPTVALVDADETGIVTLFGWANDPTDSEREIAETFSESLFLVQYHPAFEDTVAGHLALIADTMFVDTSPLYPILISGRKMRLSTEAHPDLYRSILPEATFDRAASDQALVAVVATLLDSGFDAEGNTLADGYILTDLHLDYSITIERGSVQVLGGEPYYLFWTKSGPADQQTVEQSFAIATADVRGLNPYVYAAMEKISHLAALLRTFKQQSPADWDGLAEATAPISTLQVNTAHYWQEL